MTSKLLLCLAVVPRVMIEIQFDQCLREGHVHDRQMVACKKTGHKEKGQSNVQMHTMNGDRRKDFPRHFGRFRNPVQTHF